MTEVSRQTLSALLDGECSAAEMHQAIDQLVTDETLRQCWERYHLIGHAIGQQAVSPQVRAVAPRVRAALAPTAMLSETSRRRHHRLHQFGPLAVAVAAGFALLAVLLVPFGPLGEFVPSAEPAHARAAAEPEQPAPEDDPLLRARLERLVVSHHEHAARPGLSGFVSYAAVVGHP